MRHSIRNKIRRIQPVGFLRNIFRPITEFATYTTHIIQKIDNLRIISLLGTKEKKLLQCKINKFYIF